MTPRAPLSKALINAVQEPLAFSRFIARRFSDDQCFESAGALSYTTIFALVPLLTVALSIFASFQEFSRFSEAVTSFVFRHFVPTSGEEIEAYVRDFVSKASHLTVFGTVALFVSGLLLMTSIEHSFNRIWRVVTPRRALARFVVFWTTLTLGPLLVGAGLAVSSALLASPYLSDFSYAYQLETMALAAMPFLVTFAAATLSYLIIPNCPVRLRHALLGGLFTATAFELAKIGFAEFVGHFGSYRQIYGAVAIIPLFLLWIYVCWVVALLGASLSAALGAFTHEANKRDLPERERFPALLQMLAQLRTAQARGVGLSIGELASTLPDVPESTIAELLRLLESLNIAQRTDIGSWILSRDPDLVRIRELYRSGAFLLPLSGEHRSGPRERKIDNRIDELCESAAQAAEAQLDRALAQMFEPVPAAKPSLEQGTRPEVQTAAPPALVQAMPEGDVVTERPPS
ncbi:MAG: YihY family inner membrane protein [Lysobacterales bacterium]|nr:YihY family inner membrane protein [Xanthomonadales bacterium]MCB1612072.1 YihY family inner membrane protein [Xanthomonadales bacterium]MCP5473970.1 YihY family inner membrane protein [Rhodanobacteraceae bacterium]